MQKKNEKMKAVRLDTAGKLEIIELKDGFHEIAEAIGCETIDIQEATISGITYDVALDDEGKLKDGNNYTAVYTYTEGGERRIADITAGTILFLKHDGQGGERGLTEGEAANLFAEITDGSRWPTIGNFKPSAKIFEVRL